jgi:hypothetical protein
MSKLAAILAAAILAAPAIASDPWSAQDKVIEGAFIAALVLDYRQTSNIHAGPWHEENSILGRFPTQASINEYFFTSAALHAVVTDILPAGKLRTAWQCAWIGIELGTVERNYRLGIRLNF